MLYRIFTEDKQRLAIAQIVGRFFDGFTLIPAEGYWQGEQEQSLIIEIDTTGSTCPVNRINAIASEINELNNQQYCMIQEIAVIRRYMQ